MNQANVYAKDVIIACDFNSRAELDTFLAKFAGEARKPYLKIGMELYYAEGPSVVRDVKAAGYRVFLDLKLHDIPTTVKKSMKVLSTLGRGYVQSPRGRTSAMMEAALEGLTRPDGSRPLLIAVTQLTSTDQAHMEKELLINAPIDQVVMTMHRMPAAQGLTAWSAHRWKRAR